MTTVLDCIIEPAQLTNAAATYYTSPANVKTKITKLTFCNPNAVAYQVTVYLIASAGTASATNTLTYQRTLAAGETWECVEAEGHTLKAGDFIQALADTGSKVSIRGSGVLMT